MRYYSICDIKTLLTSILIILISISCEKEKMPCKLQVIEYETGSLEDIDGNIYKTVKIGDQWWMTENLRVKKYRNSVPIFFYPDLSDKEWAYLSKGAYCYLFNTSKPFNGNLYNWYAVIDPNGIAPEGWRIPTDEDWKKLEQYIGMHSDTIDLIGWRGSNEGGKLKSTKTESISWMIDQEVQNTNESGFSALPGGCRLHDGSYNDNGPYSSGFWWTSSENSNEKAWYRYLDYKYGGIFRYLAQKTCGFSIRCVKDDIK